MYIVVGTKMCIRKEERPEWEMIASQHCTEKLYAFGSVQAMTMDEYYLLCS